MPFVDLILRLLGENPAAIYPEDKWVAVVGFFIQYDNYFMPWILGAIPILWLLIRKWRKKPVTPTMIIIAIILAIVFGFIGFFLLDWILEIGFGLSYQRMYGDLFN